MDNGNLVVAWWSAGITSAVACKLALELYAGVEIYYIHIDSAHPDNGRFKADCERWYGRKIHPLKSSKFKDQFEVIRKVKAVNTPMGAPCTKRLKKDVRHELEEVYGETILNQVWGYEFDRKQVNRAIRHGEQYPKTRPLFPLIEKGLDKNHCAAILLGAGIELPAMYRMGYSNNNCIGCVKGGMGYWNKIRVDFPEVFEEMARVEREVGYSCINGVFLDELNPRRGRAPLEVMPSCGTLCEVELADLESVSLEQVLAGKLTIYEAINPGKNG